jgi:hypothetical protein
MPIFRVDNFTRYSTTDIMDLMDKVEGILRQRGIVPKPAKTHGWGNNSPSVGGRVCIKTYGTTKKYKDKTYSDKTKRRNIVKQMSYWRSEPEIRIITPDKLFDSTLEAIGSAHKDEDFVLPHEGVAQLVAEVKRLYADTNNYRNPVNLDSEVSLRRHKIRVMDKIEKKEGKREKEWVRRRRSQKSLHGVLYELRKLDEKTSDIVQSATRAKKNSRDFMSSDEIQRAEELAAAIKNASDNLYALFHASSHRNDVTLQTFWDNEEE